MSEVDHDYQIVLEPPMVLGDLEVHTDSHQVVRKGNPIPLRKKEYQLLEFLMRNQHRVVNRHTILEYLWNYDTQAMTNTLDAHMTSLRRKVDGHYLKKMIKTIHGAGYRLSDA